jgi:putative modified peptide
VTRPALVAIDPKEDEDLVRRLATDDEFRARLARSPTDVLAEYHIELPAAEIPADVVLPPRSQMAEALRAMTSSHLAPARTSLPARAKFWPALRLSVRAAAR